MTEHAMLVLEERRLVNQEYVVDEFAVKGLDTITGVHVVGIHGGELTAGLNHVYGAQRLAEGKILLECQTMPIRHLQSDETGVVVSGAHAGVDSDAGGQLSVGPERRARDRTIQHGAGEIESTRLSCAAGSIALV